MQKREEKRMEKFYNGLITYRRGGAEISELTMHELHEYKDIDICLGYNEDQTKPSEEVLQFVANFFMQKGYRVVFNKPFSNSKTAETEHQYHSLMIEVNKHCYMNEETLEKTNGFEKFHNELQNLYKLLLK